MLTSKQHYSSFYIVIAGATFCSKAAELRSILAHILKNQARVIQPVDFH